MNAADRDIAFMRAELARVGITLDAQPPAIVHRAVKPQNVATVDRVAIRAALVAAGAPEHQLDWLTAGCPSLDDAHGYRPPPRVAWCPICDAATACDGDGCIPCRDTGGAQ